jgi:serine/threonine-protein kinase
MFELLTGRPPFQADDPLALAMKHLSAPAPAVTALVEDMPDWIDGVFAKALAKEPADRWNSVTDFARALAVTDHQAMDTRPLPALEASDRLEKYELRGLLGKGRFGSEVYGGIHKAMGHPVAIRILRRHAVANWDVARARFLKEAQVLQLSHPSVMQVRDFGEAADLVYIVTEFFEGSSLRETLVREGFLPWSRAGRLVGQLLSAAAAIHRRGGVLCGVTPEIIRLTRDEDGERLVVSAGGVCHIQDVMAMVSEATVRGAGRPERELHYVAPELLLGQPADVRADIFTIGVLVYEMVTGRRPFEAASLPTLMNAMLQTLPVDLRAAQSDLPDAMAAKVLLALSPDPQRRPSLDELQSALS